MASPTFNITKSIYITSNNDIDAKYRVSTLAERDALITNKVVQRHHTIAFDSDSESGFPRGRYELVDYPLEGNLTGVVWSIISESGRLDAEISDRISADNSIISQMSNKADLISGTVPENQLPDLVKLEVINSQETDLPAFISNISNYNLQKGDIVEIINTNSLRTLFLLSGIDKTNIQNYIELSSEDGVFRSSLQPSNKSQLVVGGLNEGTLVSDLHGKSLNEVLEEIIFPEIQSSISTPKSVDINITSPGSLIHEIGSSIDLQFDFNYIPGNIINGDGTIAGDLSGEINQVVMKESFGQNNVLATQNYPSGGYSDSITVSNVIITPGVNSWLLSITADQLNTMYASDRGTSETHLDNIMSETDLTSGSPSIIGVHKVFIYMGNRTSSPATSTQVRSLPGYLLNNLGKLTLSNYTMLSNSEELSIFIPQASNLDIVDRSNFGLHISDLMSTSLINVEDANGVGVQYTKFTFLMGSGYKSDSMLDININ